MSRLRLVRGQWVDIDKREVLDLNDPTAPPRPDPRETKQPADDPREDRGAE